MYFDPIEYDTDCHGYTLTGGQFFINNDDMARFLDAQHGLLARTPSLQAGDVIVLHNRRATQGAKSDVVHSFIYLGDGKVREAAGTVVFDADNKPVRRSGSGWVREDGTPAVGNVAKTHDVSLEEAVAAWSSNDRPPVKATAEYWRPAKR